MTINNPKYKQLDGTNAFVQDYLASLQGGVGASKLGTVQTGNGAVSRTIAAKINEITLSVKDYGAIGNGIADDSDAIQAAINATIGTITGRTIFFPAGVYKVTKAIIIGDKQNTYLQGEGQNTSVIQPTGNFAGFAAVIQFGDVGTSYQGISDLHINCSSATNVTALRMQNINGFWLTRMTINNANTGMLINAGVIHYYTDFQININKDIGIKLVGGNDHFFRGGVLSNVGYAEPTVAGFWCTKSDAFWMDSVDFITQKIGMLLAPQGTDYISWVFISNSAFDSSTGDGIRIIPGAGALVKGITITGSWTATNDFGVHITGAGTTDGVRFIGHRSFNNGKSGYVVGTTSAKNIFFNGCDASGNSISSPGTFSGFDIGAGITGGVTIDGCRSGQQANFTNSQFRGILLNPGATDNYVITNNDVRGNIGDGILDLGTGTNKFIENNLGYNPPKLSGTITPAITTTVGAITALGTCVGKYVVRDNRVSYDFDFTINTNGTGSGTLLLQLPFPVTGTQFYTGTYREVASTGITGAVSITGGSGSTTAQVSKFDNSYPGANSTRFVGTISYYKA